MVSNTSENIDENDVPVVVEGELAGIEVPPASSIADDYVADDSDDFAALLDAYDYEMPHRGQILEGVVLETNSDEVLLDVGLKRDAIVTRKDLGLLDESVRNGIIVGKNIMTYVLQPRNNDGELIVSINKALELEDWANANNVFEKGNAIDASVIDANRGGLLVRFGRLTGFVPQSHVVSLPRFTSEQELYDSKKSVIGQLLQLKFIEIDRKRNRLIMSERLARADAEQSRMAELEIGQKLSGRVVSLVKFGAFVDLGGVDGLIHISKLDHRHVNHPGEILSVGDDVDVIIDGIDEDKNRISLNRVALLPDPWESVLSEYAEGDLVQGVITNVVDFGVFVQLPNSLQGLVHVSKMTMFGNGNPRDIFREGDELLVRIISIEPERQRIGMSADDVTVDEQEEWMRHRRGDEEIPANEAAMQDAAAVAPEETLEEAAAEESTEVEEVAEAVAEEVAEVETVVEEVVEAEAEEAPEAVAEEVAEVETVVEEVVEATTEAEVEEIAEAVVEEATEE